MKAEEDTAETAIREVAQAERCEKTESKEDGAVQLLVTAKKDADVREAIYHTCVEHHMPILEMKAASKSLEDVFLELTEGEKKKSTGTPEKSQWKPVEDKSEEPEKTSDEKEGDQS